jgi:hypothetical protein
MREYTRPAETPNLSAVSLTVSIFIVCLFSAKARVGDAPALPLQWAIS